MKKLLIKNAHIIDPSQNMELQGDILVVNGKIAAIGQGLSEEGAELVNASGLYAVPGLIDIHVHLRDPGFTNKEDIITGCKAAAAGGVTSVCCMPNTKPVTDSPEIISQILEKAVHADARVYPVAAITTAMQGENLTDFIVLKDAGAIAVSDDGRPVENGGRMLEALKQANAVGLPVISHCEDLSIIDGGLINQGAVSQKLGVKGMDRASEDSITAREIVLAECSETAVHIAHVSTKGSVQLIREAKARGVKVTCETAPHYMMMTEELLLAKDANYRMNPPLREKADCEAIITGVLDGTIDAIVTDHAPHTAAEKSDFFKAPNGIIGLETSFAAACTVLVHQRGLALIELLKLMTCNPAKIIGISATLQVGAIADIVLLDPNKRWTVDKNCLHGKSTNTPFHGMELTGQIIRTFLGGRTVYSLQEN